MAGRVTIHDATLRDATYVMAWLRPADEEEVLCQVPEGMTRLEMAYNLLFSGDVFAARIGDQPVGIFGTGPINIACLSVWALGTRNMWRAVSEMNRFLIDEHLPARIAQGYHSMEARSIVSHTDAHHWIEQLGGKQHGEPFAFGSDREMFLLFRWSADDLAGIKAKRRKPSQEPAS
jgi:hypothetical protein